MAEGEVGQTGTWTTVRMTLAEEEGTGMCLLTSGREFLLLEGRLVCSGGGCCHSLANVTSVCYEEPLLVLQPVFPRLLSKPGAPCLLSHLCVECGMEPCPVPLPASWASPPGRPEATVSIRRREGFARGAHASDGQLSYMHGYKTVKIGMFPPLLKT